MGAIGGLLGLGGGAGGTGFNVNPGTNPQQIQTAYDQNSALISQLGGQNGLGNQSQVYGQLQNVAQGQGPNPAQAMLNQSTGQNVATQGALAAGQRGAASNVGLLSRQAAQTGANLQQQAAGQGATMQAQQALGALGQAGQMANTQANQQIGATQNEQQMLQNANSSANQVQGQLANTQMQGQQKTLGGVGNLIGGITGLFATGGQVRQPMATGGAAGPQSMFGQYLTAPNSISQAPTFSAADNASMTFGNKKKPDPMNAGLQDAQSNFNNNLSDPLWNNQQTTQDVGMGAAHGGQVPVVLSPGEKTLSPTQAKQVSQGRANAMQVGGTVPGKAKVQGDSSKNDTYKTKLEEGSIVIPRSVVNAKNPGVAAKKFVDAYMAKKKVK